ncbi:amidohydrolase family protein [Microbacterium sp. NPDC056044]|uniref:amidohydrolase family protein n=1 Tax=Microbacterium sp. NPDC056044 TaxID=3345690 RepID=UPI0035D861C9
MSDIASPLTARTEETAGRRFEGRWMIKNAMVIDGTGGPVFGPAHIVIEAGRIQRILEPGNMVGDNIDLPLLGVPDENVLDIDGNFLLPGLIDSHAHIGFAEQVESTEYVFKLWMGHGITTVRELGSIGNGLDFVLGERDRSSAHEIVAPKIEAFVTFGQGATEPLSTDRSVREWVNSAAARGAAGIKFFGAAPETFRAALDEAGKVGLPSACHHAQQHTARVNALTTARWGLGSIEHSYGQAEVMYRDRMLPDLPASYVYTNEHDRFAHAGRLWKQTGGPGSAAWEDFLDELVALGTTLVPTFAVYIPTRDAMAARTREWNSEYLGARLDSFFTPDPHRHGSFFYDWGTEEEIAWNENYRIWMQFVRDFSLRGGRVCAGSDSGFIYNLYGFGLIQELELFREAGMAPLEVIRSATLRAAELIGKDDEIGSIEVGKVADMLIVDENPLANLKVLYGTGHYKMVDDGRMGRVGGVKHTIKDGVLYDSEKARADVRDMVAASRS